MKNLFFNLLIFGCVCSCNSLTGEIPPPPVEPCTNIELFSLPLITHGFIGKEYDTVVIQTYRKNEMFDSLVRSYRVELRSVRDTQRQERSLNFPREITTSSDLKIIFNDSLEYRITDIKTDWVPRWCNDFCGYECTITSFKINDSLDADLGNIFIKEPSFKYPWDK